MKVELWVEIKGKIDSKALYDIIGHQGMNVTELDDKTLDSIKDATKELFIS